MTERQYYRANSVLYPIVIILFSVLLVMGVGILATAKTTSMIISGAMQCAGSIIFIILDTLKLKKVRGTKECAVMLMGSGALMYLIVMIFNNSNNVMVYSLPLLCICVIYLNVRFVKAGAAVTVLGAVIHIIKLAVMHTLDTEFTIIFVLVTGLIIAGAYNVCKLLTKFNEENIEAQSRSYEKMYEVADNLIKHFEIAQDKLKSTRESVDISKDTMTEISDSMGSTAEAIQQQALMCSEIQESTNKAESKTQIMLKSSDKTLITVNEGAKIVEGLKEQSENVQQASKAVAESSKELSTSVEEVRGIIVTILSISEQTNLLALNASIEAARAGDAGRGFAVVAEEIRKLSEQTQEATEKITSIINDLNGEAEKTIDSMEKSEESINRQARLIDTTQEKFAMIDNEVKSLTGIIAEIDGVMKNIIDSTEIITDNISHLSATSEEIAASSVEGVRVSEESYKNTQELFDIIGTTYNIAQELQRFRTEQSG